MRARPLILGVLALALLALGHWLYWYRPRERAGTPDGGTVAGRVFLGSKATYRVWVPYPHQNLGRLERALGDVGDLLDAVAGITGRPMPELPSFGAAEVPPSSELTLAAEASGESFVAVARVYPLPALLARWAGRLAGNPLLAGGRTEIGGRRVEVSWEGREWIVRTLDVGIDATASARRDVGPPALAHVDLGRAHGPLPPGAYRLERRGEDLVFEGGAAEALLELEELGRIEPPLPLVVAQTFTTADGPAGRVLALVPGVESVAGMPGAVTAHKGEKRWPLPGERVLSLVRDDPPREDLDGWTVVALERRSLEAGRGLVETARRLQAAPALDVALWVDRRGAARLVGQIIEALERVPIIGSREARPWRSAADVLDRLDRYQRLTAFVSSHPSAVVIRLERRPARAAS